MRRGKRVGYAPPDLIARSRWWGRIYPLGGHARILAAELTPAPPHIADALGIEAGAVVIRRYRVTYQDDRPQSVSTSWFAGELAGVAPLLLVTERLPQGTPRYIEDMTGRQPRHGRDQLTVDRAGSQFAADLDIAEGDPVLICRNWFRDQDGDVIEFGEFVRLAGDWQTYEYDLQ